MMEYGSDDILVLIVDLIRPVASWKNMNAGSLYSSNFKDPNIAGMYLRIITIDLL